MRPSSAAVFFSSMAIDYGLGSGSVAGTLTTSPGRMVVGSTPGLASLIPWVVVPLLVAMLEKVSPEVMVYFGPQTAGAPAAGSGVGVGATSPGSCPIEFGSISTTGGGWSHGEAVGASCGLVS